MSNNNPVQDDYLDRLSDALPLKRSLTSLERFLIIVFVSTFVSLVGCILLCLICPRSPFRRRYDARRKIYHQQRQNTINTISKRSIVVVPPPPSYDAVVKTENLPDLSSSASNRYLSAVRKSSNGTVSDGDAVYPNTKADYSSLFNGKMLRSQSARSSLSTVGSLSTISNTFPLAPYPQMNVKIEIGATSNTIKICLTNGEHFTIHPAFDEQGDYSIQVQLSNIKLLKKCQEVRRKRRASLPLNIWKKQQEKGTKNLLRKSDDTLLCNEILEFQLNKSDLPLTSLRFLLCAIDRSGVQDVMLESLIPLHSSMVPYYQQIIEFKELPQVVFAEVFLGLSYLPTSERFTVSLNKLRYFHKIEKDKKLDGRILVTFFHQGRRFFQKKVPCILDSSLSIDYEIIDTITQIIPATDIQSVYVHLEFGGKLDGASLPVSSILIGKRTSHESEWQKILDQPRQTHFAWYPFRG